MASTVARMKILASLPKRFLYSSSSTCNKIQSISEKSNAVIAQDSTNQGELNLVSGIPAEQISNRKVTIFLPSRNTMQSGSHNMRKWMLTFDTQQRWENPLMGWASSGDPLSNTQLKFSTREAAIAYCQTHGWNFEVVEPTLPTPKVKSYGANFSWNKRTRISSK